MERGGGSREGRTGEVETGQPSGWAASHVSWKLEFVELGGRMTDHHADI